MNDQALNHLERLIRIARGGRAQKLRSIPLRMARSALLCQAARWMRRPIRRRARLFWGDSMTVVLPDSISLTLYRYGFFEEGLTKTLMGMLRPGGVYFDVGAHFGYCALLAAHLVGAEGQVHAFEPTPSTFAVLRGNLEGRSNIRMHRLAVFSKETILEFHDFGIEWPAFNSIYAGRFSAEQRNRLKHSSIQVCTTTIDRYVQDNKVRPDFIKIDTEGAELDVLHGMEQTLREVRPVLSVEVDSGGQDQQQRNAGVLDLLRSAGYEPFEYASGGLVRHQPRATYTYDNLFFLHKTRQP